MKYWFVLESEKKQASKRRNADGLDNGAGC